MLTRPVIVMRKLSTQKVNLFFFDVQSKAYRLSVLNMVVLVVNHLIIQTLFFNMILVTMVFSVIEFLHFGAIWEHVMWNSVYLRTKDNSSCGCLKCQMLWTVVLLDISYATCKFIHLSFWFCEISSISSLLSMNQI